MDFYMNSVRVIIMTIVIYPLITVLGIKGAALAVLLAISATIPIWWYLLSKIVQINFISLINKLVPSLLGTGVMSLGILSIKCFIKHIKIWEFTFTILISISIYIITLILFWKKFKSGPIGILYTLKQII